jgi:GNAT superfamily N-acetyltransferase
MASIAITEAVRHSTYRPAALADLPRLCEMFERFRSESTYAQYGPAHPEASTKTITLLLTSPDGVIIVSEDADRLTGMIGLMVIAHPWSGERCASELFWWLEPEHRGRGAWLLRRAERWAVAQGAERMVMVSPLSPDVDRLYQALHYAPMETLWVKPLDWFTRNQAKPHGRPRYGIVVHDDVLADPSAYRAMALRQPFQAVQDGDVTFQRMAPCANPTLPMWIAQRYPQLTPTLSFFRQGEQDQVEPHYRHTDVSMGDWTALLYLTPDPPADDGTAFWRHVPTGDVGSVQLTKEAMAQWDDAALWERWHTVHAKFNRLVMFPSRLYHSRALYRNYGVGDKARLTHNVFGVGTL